MSNRDQLNIPPAATKDRNSFELLRVWIADKQQHVTVRAGAWKDPAAWGIMLSDLMHHIAHAYEQDQGLDAGDVLRRIKAGLDAELSGPTDAPSTRRR